MTRFAILLLAIAVSCEVSKADLIGLYEFNGDFSNSYGTLPALTPQTNGGFSGFNSGTWEWDGDTAPGEGLQLSLSSPLSVYSVGIIFRYSQVDAYRKVLDYADQTSDDGLYVVDGSFLPWPYTEILEGSIAADTTTTIILTRDAGGTIAFYQNGSSTPLFTRDDDDDAYVAATTLSFFLDDNVTGGEFSSAGSVAEIRVWDTALSAAEIPDAFAPIPEPAATTALIGLGALVLALSRRRGRN